MQIGVIYPQTELPTDVRTVRAYVSKVEELGYRHFEIYDHVLGADPAAHTGWKGPYDVETTFHEPLVFYGFLAAITQLELVTGIIVAPQRQTALLAKQAAEVDILSEGRFRLGRPAATRQRSGWTPASSKAPVEPTAWPETPNVGVTRVQPTYRWTPWDPGCRDSTPTSTP